MRDRMPNQPLRNECAIVNLDTFHGRGTHWVAYCKKENDVFYYDSFGDLPPPTELVDYFGGEINIRFNYTRYQNFQTSTCGQFCLTFLCNISKKLFSHVR